ncbi:IST1 homolog isoform X1 [Hydra vulgaris]|uniref:IST1 homolog n=1 Tax=Hydra vulgaris TaxID=6087 RepID=T2MEN8_HYDVU|nr:IST1 homolog isoform X1 [Hydra vulgaris]
MFAAGFNTQKLKTSLRLSINRLKLMEKKKTEMAMKARKEISDFLQMNKYDRARIRVEHIIREDYLVEAMELIEMYCDLLLARFGLIETMKFCDEGLVEAVSTIMWAAPRLTADCQELKTVSDQLALKYGKEFGQQARSNANNTVNERLIHKLSPDPPPKILVERYLIEIAKNYNVNFEPDAEVMMSEGVPSINSKEFDIIASGPVDIGFSHYNPPPPDFSSSGGGSSIGKGSINPIYPPNPVSSYPPDIPPYSERNPYPPPAGTNIPGYAGPGYVAPGFNKNPVQPNNPSFGFSSIPNLPDIPRGNLSSNQSTNSDDVDFDDLTKRFEDLKKKK